jgi:hypothetical protein
LWTVVVVDGGAIAVEVVAKDRSLGAIIPRLRKARRGALGIGCQMERYKDQTRK